MPILPTKTSLISIDEIIKHAAITEGTNVADLGCGRSVFFLYALSALVGKNGTVYGVDILPEAIDSARRDVIHHRLSHISIIQGDLEKENGVPIPGSSLSAAFLINTISQSTDTQKMIQESARLLLPTAKLIIVDWKKEASPFGPLDSQRVEAKHVIELLEIYGLRVLDQFAAGPYHYGIVAEKIN